MCIISFPVYNLICFYILNSFRFFRFVGDYEPNYNPIIIYLPPFPTLTNASYYFPVFLNNFLFIWTFRFSGMITTKCRR